VKRKSSCITLLATYKRALPELAWRAHGVISKLRSSIRGEYMSHPTSEGTRFVKKLIKHTEGPWHFLFLPNGKWGALWFHGLDGYCSEFVFEGEYDRGCAFVGSKKDLIEYVLQQLHEYNLQDPLNFSYKIERIREKLLRSNSKLNKFPD
jgi:hypothetical protein